MYVCAFHIRHVRLFRSVHRSQRSRPTRGVILTWNLSVYWTGVYLHGQCGCGAASPLRSVQLKLKCVHCWVAHRQNAHLFNLFWSFRWQKLHLVALTEHIQFGTLIVHIFGLRRTHSYCGAAPCQRIDFNNENAYTHMGLPDAMQEWHRKSLLLICTIKLCYQNEKRRHSPTIIVHSPMK